MMCPKCGTEGAVGEWVCARCDYILDSSFLGDDILNDDTRSATTAAVSPAKAPPNDATREVVDLDSPLAFDWGGDPVILGRLEDQGGESIVSDRTGAFMLPDPSAAQAVGPASVFISQSVAAALQPTGIPRQAADAVQRRHVLSPFEASVFELVDARRTLAEVQGAAGLCEGDARVAFAMLLEKAMIEVLAPAATDLEDRTTVAPLEDRTLEVADARVPQTQIPTQEPEPSPFDVPTDALRPSLRRAATAAALIAPAVVAPPQRSATDASPRKRRAAELLALCKQDIKAGRLGRAWGYARMAADADPTDQELKQMLADWSKVTGATPGAAGSASTGPSSNSSGVHELFAASQRAEQQGDHAGAISLMKKLCAAARGSAAAHNRLAVLIATRGDDLRDAYDAALHAVELEPANMTFQSNMMKILARLDILQGRATAPGAPPPRPVRRHT